jgi:Spy/CpxP family protein refolding chaperone
MTIVTKRVALAATAGLVVIGITAGVRASTQNTNQDPRPFSGQRDGGPRGPMGRGGPMGLGPDNPLGMLRMLGPRLGLSETQQTQLKSIAESHRDEWKALADRAMTARRTLHDAVMADQMDEALIRSKAAEAGAVEADVAVASARAKAEAWLVLTPDQQAQVKQFQAEARNRGPRGARPDGAGGGLRRRLGELFH